MLLHLYAYVYTFWVVFPDDISASAYDEMSIAFCNLEKIPMILSSLSSILLFSDYTGIKEE